MTNVENLHGESEGTTEATDATEEDAWGEFMAPDVAVLDTDADQTADTVLMDTDYDGDVDVAMFDTDADAQVDTVVITSDGPAMPDAATDVETDDTYDSYDDAEEETED